MENIHPAVYYVLSFPLIWVSVFYLISLFGWRQIQEDFALPERSLGDYTETFSWTTIRINTFANYNNCINIQILPSGIMLKLPFLFSAFHKPVYIPWHKMRNPIFKDGLIKKITVEVNKSKITFFSRVAESINFNLKDHH